MINGPLADRLTPSEVMEQMARAPPAVALLGHVIIVGNLAAG